MAKKLFEIITEDELKKILQVVKSQKHKIAFALGFYECMRISEIVKLQQENINKDMKLLLIKQAKGKKDRNVPIAPEVLGGLKNIPVGIGARALEIAFKKIANKVLGKDLNFHILRHSGVTYYLTKKKWSSLEVQRLAGHSRIATTEIYTHINPQDLVNRMWEK
jgi:integrase